MRRPLVSAGRSPGRRHSLLALLALVGGLPALVDVIDFRDVLDGRPGGARPAAHRIHERLAQLVLRGTGLLRSREASRHSGGAAGGRHGGQRHQLHRLRVESSLPVVQPRELLHLLRHQRTSLARFPSVYAAPSMAGRTTCQLALDDGPPVGRMAGMQIPLDRDKPVPLARQIQAHLERLIAERLLGPGVKLPATRELAQSLGVNRATVALAYEELIAAGWARAHVGQGTFVAGPPDGAAPPGADALRTPPINWSGLLSRSARIVEADAERARAVAPRVSGEGLISFAGGMPDSGLFPTDAFRRVLNEVVRDEG